MCSVELWRKLKIITDLGEQKRAKVIFSNIWKGRFPLCTCDLDLIRIRFAQSKLWRRSDSILGGYYVHVTAYRYDPNPIPIKKSCFVSKVAA